MGTSGFPDVPIRITPDLLVGHRLLSPSGRLLFRYKMRFPLFRNRCPFHNFFACANCGSCGYPREIFTIREQKPSPLNEKPSSSLRSKPKLIWRPPTSSPTRASSAVTMPSSRPSTLAHASTPLHYCAIALPKVSFQDAPAPLHTHAQPAGVLPLSRSSAEPVESRLGVPYSTQSQSPVSPT